jgi:hypothetical protein
MGIQPKEFEEVYATHVDHYREIIGFANAVMDPPFPFRMANVLTA